MINHDLTDVILVKKGQTLIQALRDSGQEFIFYNETIFKKFLLINSLSLKELFSSLKNDQTFFCFHPLIYSYERNDPVYGSHRMRSLDYFNHLCKEFTEQPLDALRQVAINRGNLLEIGPGSGRLILDILLQYPSINISAVGKSQGEDNFKGNESLLGISRFLKMGDVNKQSLKTKFHFKDISDGKLDFIKDESLDLVFSQATILYIKRKDILLEEIFRKLRPHGRAFLQIHLMELREFTIQDYLTTHPFQNVFKGGKFGMYFLEKKTDSLNLRLKYHPESSRFEKKEKSEFKGWYSVFSVKK